jgi:hypothetical protein
VNEHLAVKINVILITIIISGLVSACMAPSGVAQSPTLVGGIIDSDTTWTRTNSPYTLTGAVGVTSGATLTIEAGVTINLGDSYIQVNGTLKAKGSNTEPIYFIGGKDPAIVFIKPISELYEQNIGDSYIENAVFDSSSIEIINSSPKISNNTLRGRISLFNSSSPILNNYFLKGINEGLVAYDSNATIAGNLFTGLYQAIYVGSSQSYSTPLIQRNHISENQYGILLPTSTKFSPTIRNNTIVNNQLGIGIYGNGIPQAAINYNNIYGNEQYNIRLTDIQTNIDATQNWWGTTDTQAISQLIFDSKKDFNLGNVTFSPFLNEPNTHATPDPDMLTQIPEPKQTTEPSETPIPTIDPNQFNIESNSSVSAFSFDSSIPEIAFTVTGPDGTSGYVKATISKSFMPNAQNINVYLDGNSIEHSLDSNDNSWIITFNYQHSTHQVAINAAGSQAIQDWTWKLAILSIAILSITGALMIVLMKRRRRF